MRAITTRFGEVVANRAVDLTLEPGKVHAVLGENGAGKTTLMNVLAGGVQPESGEIVVGDRPASFKSPRAAMAAGIGMVHQHFRLIDGMTAAENVLVGWEGAPAAASPSATAHLAGELAERYGMRIDPSAYVWQQSVGEQQRVAILRALIRGGRVLILDEPTAVLTEEESRDLLRVTRDMVSQGGSVVFISHKLREVLQFSDTITVMRAGEHVETLPAGDCDERKLAQLMIGRELKSMPKRSATDHTEIVASVRGVAALDDRRMPALSGVDLQVKAGEIVGVAGVAGNGQRQLTEILSGLRKPTAGRVEIGAKDLTGKPAAAFMTAGVGNIPEDRKATGLVPRETIWGNSILKSFRRRPVQRLGVVKRRVARQRSLQLCEDVGLSTRNIDLSVNNLSGGNAQRLLTGREMSIASSLLIASQPTRGIDVGGAERVHEALLAARERGIGVLLVSEDLEELLALSDRLVVMYEGRIVGESVAGDYDRHELALKMGGSS
jgi:simple sugar transport system ATP-binding protein